MSWPNNCYCLRNGCKQRKTNKAIVPVTSSRQKKKKNTKTIIVNDVYNYRDFKKANSPIFGFKNIH